MNGLRSAVDSAQARASSRPPNREETMPKVSKFTKEQKLKGNKFQPDIRVESPDRCPAPAGTSFASKAKEGVLCPYRRS
jgi:hypothetical protein